MTRQLALAVAAAAALAGPAPAQQTIPLTVVAGHPPITKGVAAVRDFFVPEVDRRLAETGAYRIEWTQAYAGAVADVNGVLEAVESGIADIGYVPHLFEADKVPLEQITYVTPFGTDDLIALMKVISALHQAVPAIGEGWKRHNQMVLAPVGIDTYHFVTDFEIDEVADLDGRRIGTAGLALNWLKGSGAVPVSGALPSFYNSMSTGLIDGVMTFESAVAPYKFQEVAPYITRFSFGAQYASALTVNLDTWEGLPEPVRAVILAVADEYRDLAAREYYEGGLASLETAVKGGAQISELPAAVRADYAARMPNIAREWAAGLDARGLPGTQTLETYMRLAREAGITFARDWTAE